MKLNFNSVGDGLIVLGLGILFLTFAIVDYNTYAQNTGSAQNGNTQLEIGGLLTFSILFVLAGVFKIIQGIKAPEQPTTLKTAAIAAIATYLAGFAGFGFFSLFYFRFL